MMPRLYSVCLILVFLISCKNSTETEVEATTPSNKGFDDIHNSQNSLDWTGIYQGVLPCADCDGIKTKITLNADNTYSMTTVYLGKPNNEFQNQGQFNWKTSGNEIILEQKEEPNTYKVIENALLALDMDGNIIQGELSELYKLDKLQNQMEQ